MRICRLRRYLAPTLTDYGRSIRLIFSIADIQSEPEAEFEEGEEGVEEGAEDADTPLHSYPLRCSFSFTKVRCQLPAPSDLPADENFSSH